jgi:hypothetical protein
MTLSVSIQCHMVRDVMQSVFFPSTVIISVVVLRVVAPFKRLEGSEAKLFYCNAECRCAVWCYTLCCYTNCDHFGGCCYADCHFAVGRGAFQKASQAFSNSQL